MNLPFIPRTLLLSLTFLLAVLLLPPVHTYLFPAILVLFLLLLFNSRKETGKEAQYDRYLLGLLLLTLVMAKLLFPDLDQLTLIVRTSSLSAFVLLHAVLLIGPWSRFSAAIRKLYFYRRHLGVAVLLLGSLHAALIFSRYFNYSVRDTFGSIFTVYGFTALFIFLWLGVTSWDEIQKRVSTRWWNIVHGLLMILYVGLAMYLYALHKNETGIIAHVFVLGLFLLFWIIVAPYSLIRKVLATYVFGWKQLHLLIYVAYISILLHAWLGFFTLQNSIIKGLFWFSPILIFGSHALGWLYRWRKDQQIYGEIREINQQVIEGDKTFIGVARQDDLPEGKGKKVYVNQQPVALFRQGKEIYALSSVCAHQKGPLDQGRLVQGVVECPWHYWTYDITTGSFLGKENFCLPRYEVRVKKGVVLVSREPVNKEKVKHCSFFI